MLEAPPPLSAAQVCSPCRPPTSYSLLWFTDFPIPVVVSYSFLSSSTWRSNKTFPTTPAARKGPWPMIFSLLRERKGSSGDLKALPASCSCSHPAQRGGSLGWHSPCPLDKPLTGKWSNRLGALRTDAAGARLAKLVYQHMRTRFHEMIKPVLLAGHSHFSPAVQPVVLAFVWPQAVSSEYWTGRTVFIRLI